MEGSAARMPIQQLIISEVGAHFTSKVWAADLWGANHITNKLFSSEYNKSTAMWDILKSAG